MEAMLTGCKMYSDADLLHCNVQRPSDQVGYFSITASASSVYISAGQHRTLAVATPNPEDRQRTTCKYSSSRVRKRNLPIYLLLILWPNCPRIFPCITISVRLLLILMWPDLYCVADLLY